MADNFEYDVFISYSHANKGLVYEKVVKPLEEAGLYVWWDELVMPGSPLLEQIEKGIKSSRKTLIILTEEYLQSKTEWTEFEALLSQTLGINEKRKRLIVIKLGSVHIPDRLKIDAYFDIRNWAEINDELITKIIKIIRPEPIPAFRFTTGGSALAIGSHWDDILLGCLGTLIKLKGIFSYNVDILVLCNSYGPHYYGARQDNLTQKATDIYRRLCDACGFNNLSTMIPDWDQDANLSRNAK